jgi:hypothetical protein
MAGATHRRQPNRVRRFAKENDPRSRAGFGRELDYLPVEYAKRRDLLEERSFSPEA